jgi:arginine/lysine/ornithine decarboxylase
MTSIPFLPDSESTATRHFHYRVLVCDPDSASLARELGRLGHAGLQVTGASSVDEATRKLREDGSIHVILTEWELPLANAGQVDGNELGEGEKTEETSRQAGPRTASLRLAGADLFRRFLQVRYEVNVFLYTDERSARHVTADGLLNGYFFKGDQDDDDVVRRVESEVVNSKNRAPFFEALIEYAGRAQDSWHTPGHGSGYSVKNSPWTRDFYEFFGPNAFRADVSVSVPQLDSLLDPRGVIREAQELAARAFSSRHTFFSTNGTSTSNKILLQTLLKPDDAILLDRNCHKSVHYGVIAAGAEPVYLLPSTNPNFGIFGPVPKRRILETLDRALAAGKRVKALILTNCTYDGLIYDIADLVREVHARQSGGRPIKVVVDEAWFGYARFHPEFFPCAMEAGADYATQSTHKTMSAFSQASMIHVGDPDFEDIREFFLENLNMHTSTSPQYPMIASLDVARKQMVMEGYSLLSRALELSESFRTAVNSLSRFRVLGLSDLVSEEVARDGVRLDKLKITIDVSESGLSSREVEHHLLSKHNIQIEKSTFNTLTVLVTLGATWSKLNRLFLALENIERMGGRRRNPSTLPELPLRLSPMRYMPRWAFTCEGARLPLREAVGRVSTGMVVPYPPGIPLLVPGQIVSAEIVEALQLHRDHGVEIHGLREGLIKVMTLEEEKRLDARGMGIQDLSCL